MVATISRITISAVSPKDESDAAMEAGLTDHLWRLEKMVGLFGQQND
jgi:hypothetical protein